MRIAIVGAGALGSLFGGLLARSGQEVWLYNPSFAEHMEAIRTHGLLLQVDGEEQHVFLPAYKSVEELPGPMDLVGIFVKAYDTERAICDSRPLISPRAWVMSLQNGIGIEEVLRLYVPEAQILRGVTAQGATLVGPGVIRWAGRGPTYLGQLGPMTSRRSEIDEIIEVFNRAGIETHYEPNIQLKVWEKLLVNAAINPLTALFDVPNGQLIEDPTLRDILHQVIQEVHPIVAAQINLNLSLEEAIRRVEEVCRATAKNISSMLQDVRRGKRTEIEFINGAVVKAAEGLGRPVPLNQLLTELIRRQPSAIMKRGGQCESRYSGEQ